MRDVRFGLVATLLLTGLFAGCGSKTAELKGKVTLNGDSLAHGEINMYNDKEEVIATSSIVKGEYHFENIPPTAGAIVLCVQTFTPKGVPVGVRTMQPVKDPQMQKKAQEEFEKSLSPVEQEILKTAVPVPKKYWTPKQSDLKAAIKAGVTTYNIEMTGKGEIPVTHAKKK